MEHPDEVLDTAAAYAEHTIVCPECAKPGIELCPDGMKLMKRFHDALNDSLVKGVSN